MTSLLEQKEKLLNLQRETQKKLEKINREIYYENRVVEDMEQSILSYLEDVSSILTHLRDHYGKIYSIEAGYLHSDAINIKLIEPKGGPNGYARTIEKIEIES